MAAGIGVDVDIVGRKRRPWACLIDGFYCPRWEKIASEFSFPVTVPRQIPRKPEFSPAGIALAKLTPLRLVVEFGWGTALPADFCGDLNPAAARHKPKEEHDARAGSVCLQIGRA